MSFKQAVGEFANYANELAIARIEVGDNLSFTYSDKVRVGVVKSIVVENLVDSRSKPFLTLETLEGCRNFNLEKIENLERKF